MGVEGDGSRLAPDAIPVHACTASSAPLQSFDATTSEVAHLGQIEGEPPCLQFDRQPRARAPMSPRDKLHRGDAQDTGTEGEHGDTARSGV